MYPTGVVEKYEGNHAYSWVENIIKANTPEVPQIPVYTQEIQGPRQQRSQQRRQEHIQEHAQGPPSRQPIPIQERMQEHMQDPELSEIPDVSMPAMGNMPIVSKIPARMTPIDEDDGEIEETDRHITKPGPKRIRQDDNGYYEGDELFTGEQEDIREKPGKIKPKKNSDVQSRAREMEKEREMEENAKKIRH
jgi:hypothetical protein